MDTADIKAKAEQYCHSYAAAVRLGATDPSTTTAQIAEAIFKHYLQDGFTAFVLGSKSQLGNAESTLPSMTRYMDKWVSTGLGLDIRMDKYRIEVLSPWTALCFITWSIHPPAGFATESWAWENMYSFRMPPGQEAGYWEFGVSDNETMGLLQRFPDFMDGIAG